MKIPAFNPFFATILSLTLFSGGTAIHLTTQVNLSQREARLLDSALAIWMMSTTNLLTLRNGRSDK